MADRFPSEASVVSGVDVVAAYDIDEAKGKNYVFKHENVIACQNVDDLYDSVDAVYVATPHLSHYQDIKDAILAHKHVLCETPLTLKGQHTQDRGRMVRQSDGQTSKTAQNTAEKLYDLGKVVRDVFPDADNSYITLAMQAIRNFAALHHLRAERVARLIKQKK